MSENNYSSQVLATDESLANIVDDLAARVQAGESIDIESLSRAYPEHVERIGELLPALNALAGLGEPVHDDEQSLELAGRLGEFRIVREIGRGGMGVVYEAQQLSLGGRRVALKVLPLAGMYDPRHLLRFQNEARAAACLNHPHIVPVFAVGCDRGVHYYAMQFIEGLTLAAAIDEFKSQDQTTRIDTGSPPSTCEASGPVLPNEVMPTVAKLTAERTANPREFIRNVVRLGKQAASGLDHAHQQGIIHRDIKPANLLLDSDDNVWITDFGLAHFREECGITRTGEVVGTLRYMSPEQTHGRRMVDQRTDIYSLGVTLYELLALQPAFRGDDRQDLLRRIGSEEPPSVRRFNRAVPVSLDTIIAKAMSKSPDERYTSAQDFADDLQCWLDDRPIKARPLSRWQKTSKWSYRHLPLLGSLAASLVLLMIGLVIGTIVYAYRQGELAEERSKWAKEKEMSERRIEESYQQLLLAQADLFRSVRHPGYRRQVWSDLAKVNGHRDQMRAVILACLGDPIGLDPEKNPEAICLQQKNAVPDQTQAEIERLSVNRGWRKKPDVMRIAASSSGNFFAEFHSSNPRVMFLFDRAGKPIQYGDSPLGGIYDLRFTPDERSLVAGCEQGFFVWGWPVNARWAVSSGNVTSVAVSPNGRLLAIGGGQLELWSLTTSRIIASFPRPRPAARVEFSADGRFLLAVEAGKAIEAWPVRDTPERKVLDGHLRGVPSVAFKPDGKLLVSVSKDRVVQLWDVVRGESIEKRIGHVGEIQAVALSPDGSLFATGDFQGRVCLWDFSSAEPLAQMTTRDDTPGQIWQLRFSPNGEYLVAAGASGVTVWRVRKNSSGGVARSTYRVLAAPGDQPGSIDLAIRPNSSDVVFLTWSGQVYTFDLNKIDELPHVVLEKVSGKVRSLHFSAQGNQLAFLTCAGTFGLMDWQSKKVSDTGIRAEMMDITHDGRYAALGDTQSQVTIIELATGAQVLTLPSEGSEIWCLAWSKDASRLAVGLADGGVRIWNLDEVRARLADFGLDFTPNSNSKEQIILWQRLIRGDFVHQPAGINSRSLMSP